MSVRKIDHLIIGSGIAGLSLALKLGKHESVMVIAKGTLLQNNSAYAQGGIASVLGADDSFEEHIHDTINAGAGLCHKDVVADVVSNGPGAIAELIDLGVDFTLADIKGDSNGSDYHLTQEGGHSKRRVIHSKDLTGRAVMSALIENVLACKNIEVCENQSAVDLLTTDKFAPDFAKNSCMGAYVYCRKTQLVSQIRASNTYLCTGGHGKLYLYTSNPDNATGDGLAMGWRAGCKVANLEFMQFHPTCLFDPKAKTFLISEAVRGEGGVLKNAKGEEFMKEIHELGSLAPRDVVARAIDAEIKKTNCEHVYLDVRHIPEDKIRSHFPNIFETCMSRGIDMRKEMIPVVPAAHYSCGGLVVNSRGQTTVENLFALGEVSCTGLHGANRLASNSLLEALVFAGHIASSVIGRAAEDYTEVFVPKWNKGKAAPSDEVVVLNQIWDELRRLMWNYVGIVRSDKRLKRAYHRIISLRQELDTYYWDFELSDELLEVRNLCQTAWLTVRCAMSRKESRGIHFNMDHTENDDVAGKKDTILS